MALRNERSGQLISALVINQQAFFSSHIQAAKPSTLWPRLRPQIGDKPMFEFVSQHQFGIAVAAYWIFSAAVSSLPDPSPSGSAGYLWLYRFCHTTAGNITTALGSRIPELKA